MAYNLSALVVAFLLALPVAWDREKKKSSPGLRTIPLVSLASCAYVLISISVLEGDSGAQARILQGLVTGVGFVGGGAILKSNDHVSGTATAASIWAMGALGAAVAYRRLEIALLLAVVTFATLRWLKPLKRVACEDEA
ncbi:MAG: magnesium transporter MgtC [Planctomycetes bacterium]|nr:magnesium transporter MgtC [Planctomycetota bacterium]